MAASSVIVRLLLRSHGEPVGPVVSSLVQACGLGVPLDPTPPHFLVALCRFKKPLPQVPVCHRLLKAIESAVLSPLLVPTPPLPTSACTPCIIIHWCYIFSWSASRIWSETSWVLAFPPRSEVRTGVSARTCAMARMMASPASALPEVLEHHGAGPDPQAG